MNHNFFDFLNISSLPHSQTKLIVFYGKSGSGKSTYLEYFFHRYYLHSGQYLFHKILPIAFTSHTQQHIFIDEIYNLRGWIIVGRYLLAGKQVWAASHLHPLFFSLFKILYTTKFYFTDINQGKIEHILKLNEIVFEKQDITKFLKKYLGNFTDLEIILETRQSGENFGEMFARFERDYSMKINPTK